MTDPFDEFPLRPRHLPEEYRDEAARNLLWLCVLRSALHRGLTDREAGQEACDAVPEALQPSRFPDGKPSPDERAEPGGERERSEPRRERRPV